MELSDYGTKNRTKEVVDTAKAGTKDVVDTAKEVDKAKKPCSKEVVDTAKTASSSSQTAGGVAKGRRQRKRNAVLKKVYNGEDVPSMATRAHARRKRRHAKHTA